MHGAMTLVFNPCRQHQACLTSLLPLLPSHRRLAVVLAAHGDLSEHLLGMNTRAILVQGMPA
jgi:hypothetical protein